MTTVVSDFHAKVMRWFEKMGLELMEEVPFPPYQVDIYLPEYHAAIEVDGPQHGEKRDAKRDKALGDKYQLVIFHINAKLFRSKKKLTEELLPFLDAASFSAFYRFEAVQDRIPWL